MNSLYRPFFAAVLALCVAAAAWAAQNLLAAHAAYSVSRAEYAALRAEYAPESVLSESENPFEETSPEAGAAPDPAELNPDYVGWIRIADTAVDYPAVRGSDNKKYLSAGFMGEKSKAGAVFMDYRCEDGFDGFHAVLYGHNMKDGSMFSELNRYPDTDWRSAHSEITVTLRNGAEAVYRVFSARITDVFDAAYDLDFSDADASAEYFSALGAPEDARVLTLSTCTNGGNKDARLLVHAARTE
ncbi:MAG: class B sortase [Clostridiales Family XIII bacterium]|nr:class B sortase [Clostridiales Family XIII bacterium]